MSLEKKALKKAVWGSLAKFIGVFMGAGAGAMLHQIAGDRIKSITVGCVLAVVSWFLMLYSEYQREKE
jgi:hypothetical protein